MVALKASKSPFMPSLTSVATPQFNTEGREGNFVEKKGKEGEARGRNITLDYILSR